jgi:hypothetical protein
MSNKGAKIYTQEQLDSVVEFVTRSTINQITFNENMNLKWLIENKQTQVRALLKDSKHSSS